MINTFRKRPGVDPCRFSFSSISLFSEKPFLEEFELVISNDFPLSLILLVTFFEKLECITSNSRKSNSLNRMIVVFLYFSATILRKAINS